MSEQHEQDVEIDEDDEISKIDGQVNYINTVFDALIGAVNEAKKAAPTATRDEDFAMIEAVVDIAQVVVIDVCRAATALERIADVQEAMMRASLSQTPAFAGAGSDGGK